MERKLIDLQDFGLTPPTVTGESSDIGTVLGPVMGVQEKQPETRTPEQIQASADSLKLPSRLSGAYVPLTEEQEAQFSDPNAIQKLLGTTNKVLNYIDDKTEILQLGRSFNELLSFLADPYINLIAKGLETAGVIEKSDNPQENRNLLSRLLNSDDYENQRVLIPFLLNIGVGSKIGMDEEDGALAKTMRTIGDIGAPVGPT